MHTHRPRDARRACTRVRSPTGSRVPAMGAFEVRLNDDVNHRLRSRKYLVPWTFHVFETFANSSVEDTPQQMRVSTLNARKARKKNDSVTRWTCLIEGWYRACEGLNGFQQRFRRIKEEMSRRHENWGLKSKPEGLRWFEMVWGNRLCGLLVWKFCDQKYRGLHFRKRFDFVASIVVKSSLSFERK